MFTEFMYAAEICTCQKQTGLKYDTQIHYHLQLHHYTFCLSAAFCCISLRFKDNTPIVTEQSDGTYTVSFSFMHGNVGGNYMCFVREFEASQTGRCAATPQQQACQPMQTITMTGLQPGGWFSCGIRCSLGSVQRRISRSFPTPAASGDCCPYLINDGAS